MRGKRQAWLKPVDGHDVDSWLDVMRLDRIGKNNPPALAINYLYIDGIVTCVNI